MPSTRPDPDPSPRRSLLATLALAQVLSWAALFYGFSSFVLPMERELGWSEPVVMGAYTLGLAVWGACAYGVGLAIDRGHGRRVMTGGALLAATGFAAWSRATAPWHLYAAWALLGVAQATNLYEPAFSWLTRRYPTTFRPAITALTLVGGFASTLSYPAIAGLQAAWGWRGALLALAGVMAAVVAPLQAWAMRPDRAGSTATATATSTSAVQAVVPLRVAVSAPESAGPDVAAASRPTAAVADSLEDGLTLEAAWRTRAFRALTLAFLLHAFVSAALFAHVIPALRSAGLEGPRALAVLVWFGPAQVAGRALHVAFGRHWRIRDLGVAVFLLMTASLVLFSVGHGVVAMVVFALAFGAGNGLVTIVRGAVVPDWFGAAQVGRISGAMAAIGLLARAAAPLLAAAWLHLLPGYAVLMGAMALLMAAATLAFRAAGPPPAHAR